MSKKNNNLKKPEKSEDDSSNTSSNSLNFFLIGGIVILTIAVFLFTLAGINSQDSTKKTNESLSKPVEVMALKSGSSCSDLSRKINELGDRNFYPMPSMPSFDISTKEDLSTAENQTIPDGFKSNDNNNQVSGVDEADTIKIRDNYIFQITENKLKLASVDLNLNLKMEAEFNLQSEAEFGNNNILINKDKLVLISSNFEKTEVSIFSAKDSDLKSQIKNKKLLPIKSFTIPSLYTEAREVDGQVLIVTNSFFNFDITSAKENINSKELKTALEKASISSPNSEENLALKCEDVNYTDTITSQNQYSNIVKFNLDDELDLRQELFLGDAQTVYSSKDNTYIAYTNYNTNEQNSLSTTIFKFRNSDISLMATGNVNGTLLNKYSLDEYNGNLRLVTSGVLENVCKRFEECSRNENGRTNQMIVLNNKLEQLGSVKNLAKNENVYAVRFLEEKAYVVTFETVDPLFSFDLSDPKNPKLTGELKIPGFSNYLHPVGKNLLLGIGSGNPKEKLNDNSNFAQNYVKLSLFDVSDKSKPVEKNVIFLEENTTTDVSYDPKSFFFDSRNNLISIPVSKNNFDAGVIKPLSEPNSQTSEISIAPVSGLVENYAYVMSLNNQTIKIKAKLSHKNSKQNENYTNDYMNKITRQAYINNGLVTFSEGSIKIYDIKTMTLISETGE